MPVEHVVAQRLPSAAEAKAFFGAAASDTFSVFASLASPPAGSVKLVLVQRQSDGPPVQIAYAQVYQIPQIGAHLLLDRAPNERLPVMYRVVDVNHILVANTPVPNQTAVAFIEPVDGRPIG